MLTWPCAYPECTMLCKIRMGACEYCRAHYCETHFFDHACFFLPTRDEAYELGKRKEMEEIEALFKLLQSSTDSIKRSAEALRPGHTCTLQFPSSAEELKVMAGGMNVHIPLRFEDGVEWMVRIRQQRYGNPPKAFVRQTILSEAATQNALNDAGCKVPRAFLPPLDNASDELPIDYFFVERVYGKQKSWEGGPGEDDLRSEQNTIRDLVRLRVGMASVFFDKSGGIVDKPNTGHREVGPFLEGPDNVFVNPLPPHGVGPFASAKERYLAHIDHILENTPTCFFVRQERLFGYLWHLVLRELVAGCEELEAGDGKFYVKHADDSHWQHLLDDQDHIVATLDWEWAYTTCKAEAFSTPIALIDYELFYTLDTYKIRGQELLFIEELERQGRPDLADCVRNGRKFQHLNRLIGWLPDIFDVRMMMEGFTGDRGPEETISEWKARMQARFADNEVVKRLVAEREEASLS